MARISKPPEVRRQEILDTAMELFAEKGYEDTSMADIARRMGVVQGLCYRYFDSKRVLFQEAMEQYVKECCAAGLPIIHDRSRTIRQRLDAMAEPSTTGRAASPSTRSSTCASASIWCPTWRRSSPTLAPGGSCVWSTRS